MSGDDDAYTFIYAGVLIIMIREVLINKVFRPLAKHCGVPREKHQRWGEQVFYATYWAAAFIFEISCLSQVCAKVVSMYIIS